MDIRYRLCGFLEEWRWAACLDGGGADGEKTEGGNECEGGNKKQLVVLSRCQKGTGEEKGWWCHWLKSCTAWMNSSPIVCHYHLFPYATFCMLFLMVILCSKKSGLHSVIKYPSWAGLQRLVLLQLWMKLKLWGHLNFSLHVEKL